jgi:putative transposase
MIAFIEGHREAYGVEPICRTLRIAPSTYHEQAARRRDPSRAPGRQVRDHALMIDIRRIWGENFQVYGVRKVWRQLLREGIKVARCTVARLMWRMGLKGAVRGKVVKTTISNTARHARSIGSTGRSSRRARTGSGWPTLPTSPPGPDSSMLPS